ncbi:MAG: multicopper oxidase family protein [Nitrosopumilus sp.]|nr:multicopper oxidase family protein [Nitrosopumilus sp.]NNL58393.1 multicopper oxidase family protein [Nitrosopumilus sp.]
MTNTVDRAAIFWTIGIVAVGIGFSLYGINSPSPNVENPKIAILEQDSFIQQKIDSTKLVSDMSVITLSNNDQFDLVASDIVKNVDGKSFEMLGYNQESPGPLLLVSQGDKITVNFKNDLEFPTTVHWHGLRLDYTSDGVPGITQDPVLPGDAFEYELKFPDSGMFLYHPHVRTEMQMDLGLYGNILVESKDKVPTTLQIPLILDDILISDGNLEEYDLEIATHTLMGRFGNTMMINGNTEYSLQVKQGDTARLYLTNTANTRVFDFGIEQHKLKLVADDASNYEKQEFVDSVILASSERRIVDVMFDKTGKYSIMHSTPEKSYKLGTISVIPSDKIKNYDFDNLVTNIEVVDEIDQFRKYFTVEPDLKLEFDVKTSLEHMKDSGNDDSIDLEEHEQMQSMNSDKSHSMEMNTHGNNLPLIEWEDEMPMMNAISNDENTRWILRDVLTGNEGFDIDYTANVGDIKKIRLFNNPESDHPMQHPIHLHGQRFLVLSEDGVQNENLAWKDTVLVPTGKTVDILVEFSNPGNWVMHCHILEHAEAGMITEVIVN